jgi:hypothetical protein
VDLSVTDTDADRPAEPDLDNDEAARDLYATAANALARLVDNGHFRRLALTKYPDAIEPALIAAGFTASPKGLTRYGASG